MVEYQTNLENDLKVYIGNSDTLPSVYCEDFDKLSDSDVEKLKKAKFLSWPPTELYANIEELHERGIQLHPRVETLLHFSQRPQNIHIPGTNKIIRIVKNEKLLDVLDEFPLLQVLESNLSTLDQLLAQMKDMQLDSSLDTHRFFANFNGTMESAVPSSYNNKGQLSFLEELK